MRDLHRAEQTSIQEKLYPLWQSTQNHSAMK